MSGAPIPFARPWVTDEDRAAVDRVLRGHILTHGPECAGFEADFAALMGPGAHCVSVSSCMAALHLAYLCLGIGPGDEVVVPAQTHVATAHAVELVGATPVFIDADPATGNVTPEVGGRGDRPAHAGGVGGPLPRHPLRHARHRGGGARCRARTWSRTAPCRSAPAGTASTPACSATSAASRSIRSSTSPAARAGCSSPATPIWRRGRPACAASASTARTPSGRRRGSTTSRCWASTTA